MTLPSSLKTFPPLTSLLIYRSFFLLLLPLIFFFFFLLCENEERQSQTPVPRLISERDRAKGMRSRREKKREQKRKSKVKEWGQLIKLTGRSVAGALPSLSAHKEAEAVCVSQAHAHTCNIHVPREEKGEKFLSLLTMRSKMHSPIFLLDSV